MKPSPACFSFNFEQNDALLYYLDQTVAAHNITERNIAPPKKMLEGKPCLTQ